MTSRAADITDEAHSSTRDSITVAVWTAVSRLTGLVRVIVIAAVLGPTFLGNTYQFTNSVPNLVYYGLLGGSLVSSLLVPTLVRHLAVAEHTDAAAVARGLFGCAVAAAAVAVPIIMIAVPFALRATSGGNAAQAHAQISVATWLVALLAPQIVCYAVIACSVAVMNAHRRFALAAAAPSIENLGSIVVLALVWVGYGAGREVTDVSGAEIALLGIGTTAAVVAHATVQWLGARRCRIALIPRAGWRDAEVRAVAARSLTAVGQAGLWAVELLVALSLANKLPGAVVAVLIATNFFFLPIALGATPIALSALPRLAAHHVARRDAEFDRSATRALSLTVFVAAPAAAGYLVLAPQLSRIVTFGSSATSASREQVSAALAALAPGVVGTALFTVATYISYARDDVRTPFRSMVVQSIVAVAVMLGSLGVAGPNTLLLVSGGLSAGALTGAGTLLYRIRLAATSVRALARSAGRTAICVAVMAPITWCCDSVLARHLPSRAGQTTALLLAVLVGIAVYALAQRAVRSPELMLVVDSASRRHRPAKAASAP